VVFDAKTEPILIIFAKGMIRSENNSSTKKSGSLLTLFLCFIGGMVAAFLFWWLVSRF
jgi:hypothetical protein